MIISNKKEIFSLIVLCKHNIEFKFSSVILSGVLLNKFNKLFIFKVFCEIGSIFFFIFLGTGPICSSFILFSLSFSLIFSFSFSFSFSLLFSFSSFFSSFFSLFSFSFSFSSFSSLSFESLIIFFF